MNQSDLAFLRERARAVDAEVWMDGTTLHAKRAREPRRAGRVELTYGSDLREFTVLADLADQRTERHVSGWDVAGKTRLEARGDRRASISGELERRHQRREHPASRRSATRKETLAHTVPLTEPGGAGATPSAFFKLTRAPLRRRPRRGRDRRAGLRVGGYVELDGLGPLFSGKYYLTEVTPPLRLHARHAHRVHGRAARDRHGRERGRRQVTKQTAARLSRGLSTSACRAAWAAAGTASTRRWSPTSRTPTARAA